jgi:hypothetical protein
MYKYDSSKPINVILPNYEKCIGKWYDKKELVACYLGLTVKDDKPYRSVTVKFFMGRSSNSSTVYCNFWIDNKDSDGNFIYCNGSGQAGGYGYDKISAAFQDALDDSGIKTKEKIGGVGSTAIIRMIQGIMVAQGYSVFIVEQIS